MPASRCAGWKGSSPSGRPPEYFIFLDPTAPGLLQTTIFLRPTAPGLLHWEVGCHLWEKKLNISHLFKLLTSAKTASKTKIS